MAESSPVDEKKSCLKEFDLLKPRSDWTRLLFKSVRWLSEDEVQRISFFDRLGKAKILRSSNYDSFKPIPIGTKEEAFYYLYNSVSLHYAPTAAIDGGAFYYFSYPPKNDFEYGSMVDKQTGEISGWECVK